MSRRFFLVALPPESPAAEVCEIRVVDKPGRHRLPHETEIRDVTAEVKRLRDELREYSEHLKMEVAGRLDMEREVKRLRLLIRVEQTPPPFDVADDQTTEFAVEIAELKAEVERLTAILP